jgi:large subunit ribosomal protein L19
MERVFLLHSPRIAKIDVVKQGDVRRGKLYHLRGTSGKASKVKGRLRNRVLADDSYGTEDAVEEIDAQAEEAASTSSNE